MVIVFTGSPAEAFSLVTVSPVCRDRKDEAEALDARAKRCPGSSSKRQMFIMTALIARGILFLHPPRADRFIAV
jgi:hypothetical protein